ncbi:MAG: cytidylate kinase [Flavobacteriales bacterium CG18_big_fil_WC_8_21_14_2_50_32_9]|nr:(d)CMP kinase [Flavobacteriales bacterium]PIQ14513.1 MAG: cytidylate kinase [Flavobacteriales bacterium CG18_big_fil_WC_8_21_14_2_50_32_9]PJC61996.1 MAG: cytidylate kinase [Flavobacteriales bacterium CG_4_9_14_0_2_um_filter_32_27]
MKKIIIAIDGYSSCGKSTLAKQLARKLNYVYIDTGAMYRAVALFALQNGFIDVDFFDEKALIQHLDKINVSFSFNSKLNTSETFLNGKNIEREIRGITISNLVSKIAKIKEVRAKMVELQREMGKKKGLVMDGRDIGSVVFPNAELKIFMTAAFEIRAKRRFDELKAKGDNTSYEAVLKNIVSRDDDDTSRTENPLIKAHDAVVLDNSNINQEEQFLIVMNLVNEKLKS